MAKMKRAVTAKEDNLVVGIKEIATKNCLYINELSLPFLRPWLCLFIFFISWIVNVESVIYDIDDLGKHEAGEFFLDIHLGDQTYNLWSFHIGCNNNLWNRFAISWRFDASHKQLEELISIWFVVVAVRLSMDLVLSFVWNGLIPLLLLIFLTYELDLLYTSFVVHF